MTGSWAHLAGRFVRAHRPGPVSPADRAFVAAALTGPELALWERLPAFDHHHTVEVARRVEAALAGTAHAGDGRWLAAALLHDVGKLASGFGIYARVLATLAGKARPGCAEAWAGADGMRRRVSDYLRHDGIGAQAIAAAGGRPEPAHWAAVHHHRAPLDPGLIPTEVAKVMAAADPD